MNPEFYLPRTLMSEKRSYSEAELLNASKYIVVLAEPGGGKTELLKSLANQLGTSSVTANSFRFLGATQSHQPLVIDGFDEMAKIDHSRVDELFVKAATASPSHLIISSRSSEWDNASTHAFKGFIECDPLIVRLCELNDSEQRSIFENHLHGESFTNFHSEVARFDLHVLLPNPQFLKMLADAYLESNRHFPHRQSVFRLAVERQAKEVNVSYSRRTSLLSLEQKISLSSEIFTKLLLSGREAVSTREQTGDELTPTLNSLINSQLPIDEVLSTRLFKPSDNPDHHRPVHKIIAEYCAANYLIMRLMKPSDPLALSACLAIIAPNTVVREELRGLVGWMAALGDQSIQKALIELDSYAVLSNGDPSLLSPSSKLFLLSKLKETETHDPYFRRQDYWRRFSVSGFFTDEVVEEIKQQLASGSGGQLQELILELLRDSSITQKLEEELRQIILNPNEHTRIRKSANTCLLETKNYNCLQDVKDLIAEASQASLEIAAQSISSEAPNTFKLINLENFFRAAANLYPAKPNTREREFGKRYFIKQLTEKLNRTTCENLLDSLTSNLRCSCGKKSYACECRTGISKVIVLLLDRYFEIANPPFDPLRIWNWLKGLNFHNERGARESKSVQVISNNTELRQAILTHVFGELTDGNQIFELQVRTFSTHSNSHSGLRFIGSDREFLINLAFKNDNPNLWASFIQYHQRVRKQEQLGADNLRRHMREQALEKPVFMEKWAKYNRSEASAQRKRYDKWEKKQNRSMRRIKKRQDAIHVANKKYIQENKELVEKGEHFAILENFATTLLFEPDKVDQVAGDSLIFNNALANCLDFIATVIPDLQGLAELQCKSKKLVAENILLAACIIIMRKEKTLKKVDISMLKALATNMRTHYSAIPKDEHKAFKEEVYRILFPDTRSAEIFLKEYVEPQLANPLCPHPQIGLLQYEKPFEKLKGKLSIEWIDRYIELAPYELASLFELAAQHGNRIKLQELIAKHCANLMAQHPTPTNDEKLEQRRSFWFVRAFAFLKLETSKPYWNWLISDKNSILKLSENYRLRPRGEKAYWPKLTADKIEAILTAFIEQWPKVHLPSSWGTVSPSGEKAYRFLTDIIWHFNNCNPASALPAINRLLEDQRFVDMHDDLKSIRAQQLQKNALRNFEPPPPRDIVAILDKNEVVTVEGLRQLILQELAAYQSLITGGEFNTAVRFYLNNNDGEYIRRDEPSSMEIIEEYLSTRLTPQNITITPEHQTKNQNRIDFTAAKHINGKRRLLVVEGKGQWHKELYTAASTQLYDRYSIHPDAEHQGIYLVIWFGAHEKIANSSRHGIANASGLKKTIEDKMPTELRSRIDVFVLDVSLD